MKNVLILALVICSISFFSCNKKEYGTCYCKYVNGEKKEFDLSHLDRNAQMDSCNQIDVNASHFGGSCKLE